MSKRETNTKTDDAEIRKDAEAIVRIMTSRRVPKNVRYALGQALDPHVDNVRDDSVAFMEGLLKAIAEGGE